MMDQWQAVGEATAARNRVADLQQALRALVEDCAPVSGEGDIPNAPSRGSYEFARACLNGGVR